MIRRLSLKYIFSVLLGLSLLNSQAQTVTVSTFAGSGTSGSTNGNGTAASFNKPQGLAVDNNGNIYVADAYNHLIRKITPQGVVTTFAGSGTYGSTNGNGTSASFYQPIGLAFDGSGNLYVADNMNNLIRKITPSGDVTTFAGSGTAGAADGTGTAASFNSPAYIAIDGSGNLYVTEVLGNKIRKITSSGVVTTLAGSGTAGSTDGTGTSASFYYPHGIVLDGSGNLFVVDANNNKIRKITPNGTVSTLVLSNGEGSIVLNGPACITIDGSDNLYVSLYNNRSVIKINSAGLVTDLAGNGNNASVDGSGATASFKGPKGLCFVGTDKIYLADQEGHTIRLITISNTTGTTDSKEYSNLSLYPNPTQSELHIDVDGTKNIRIIDAMGRVVMEQEIYNNQLSVAHLPKGLYAVIVEQMGKKYVSRLAKE